MSSHATIRPGSITSGQTSFMAEDAVALAGVWIAPPAPASVTVIHGATGILQGYYRAFAEWLAAETNTAVLTYDYRGLGASRSGSAREAAATMADWMVLDQSAALNHARQRHPGLPLDVVGHSLGGLGLPFQSEAGHVRRLVAVASGPVHWTQHPPRFRAIAAALWFAIGPAATRFFGRAPGRLLGVGADLPAGVFWQWRRWCLARGFHEVDWGTRLPRPDLDRFTGALRIVGVSDDVMIPPACTSALARYYPGARIEQLLLTPADAGLASLGHVRLFSPRAASAWPRLIGV